MEQHMGEAAVGMGMPRAEVEDDAALVAVDLRQGVVAVGVIVVGLQEAGADRTPGGANSGVPRSDSYYAPRRG
jgi:hypothetical protein